MKRKFSRFFGKLELMNGAVFFGESFGSRKSVSGEVVFSTGMVGYPESLTDPSYLGQILVLTFPLIGNYGVPKKEFENGLLKNFESEKIQVKGLITANYSEEFSHWSAEKSLSQWLKEEGVPALTGIDSRALTKILREQGTMLGRIQFNEGVEFFDPNRENLVSKVSAKKVKCYGRKGKTILLIDCGVKNQVIHSLLERNVKVLRVPWDFDPIQEKTDFDAVLVSNGPGDPKKCIKTIQVLKRILKQERPVLGICLGNQLLALASGADTFKLKFGHRSQNQPCIDLTTGKCFISTQNHGFAVKKGSLSSEWMEWFVNANDSTNEGIKHKSKPFYGVQFHPEASPGPTDTGFLFDEFLKEVK